MIYKTNTVEELNSQIRKVTKNKSVFPTEETLLKMPYLVAIDITL
ncbi:MAG: transposase [Eubacterium sp.]|nr:transposase [Eubacterium sp.]